MRPRVGLGVTRQEAASGDGAGLGAADVGHVGKRAVELLLIFLEQRQLPGAVTGAGAGIQQLRDQLVVVAHQAGGVAAQGDNAGTGQGGDIDHAGGLEAFGVGQRVAQHQAAFGIGVENFNGLAGHAGDDVAGARRGAARHVLGRGDQANQIDRQLQAGDRLDHAEYGCGAAHVVLHLVHGRGWFDADAAGVEGDALANQNMRFVLGLAAVVADADQLGRLGAAGADRQQGAHAEGLHGFLVEHFDFECLVVLGERLGLVGQVSGSADVARQIAQVAGQGHAFADGGAFGNCLFECVSVGLVGGPQAELFQLRFVGLLALELVKAVQVVVAGLDQQAGLLGGGAVLHAAGVERKHGVARRTCLDCRQSLLHQLAPGAVAQRLILAAAEQQHTLGSDAGEGEQHQAAAALATEVAVFQRGAQLPAAGLVQIRRRPTQRLAFVDRDNQTAAFDGFQCAVLYVELHGAPQDKSR